MRASCELHVLVIKCGSHVLSLTFELQHLSGFTILRVLILCSPLCSEVCLKSSDQEESFQTCWWRQPRFLFSLWNTIPAFTSTNEELQSCLSKGAIFTLRELIPGERFESNDHCHFRKQVFLFVDAIDKDEEILYDRNYKWLRQIGEYRFFLPNMEQMFPLSHIQSMSLPWYMDWDLVRAQLGVTIEKISNRVAFSISHSREVLVLFSGSLK